MTNEEAIRILKNSAFLATVSKYEDIEEAVEMAVNALKEIDHIKWERDMVYKQINDLGCDLVEKIRAELNNSSQKVWKASDADRILKILESAKDKNGDVPMSIVRKAFDKLLPSAQPEIIRCEDCKHHHYESEDIPYCDRIDYGYGWKDDDFCSKAERRTDD